MPATADEALSRATSDRPELGAAASQVAMREREVKAERAAYLPTIDIVGGYANDSSNSQLTHENDSWLVGATAELSIFSGFRTREKVAPGQAAPPQESAPTVASVTVEEREIDDVVDWPGTVTARLSAEVAPTVMARVLEVRVQAGRARIVTMCS